MVEVISIKNSAIKGYHYFKITLHERIPMYIKKEANNPKDESAMLIYMPEVDKIPKELHHLVTRAKKTSSECDQSVLESSAVGVCTLIF